MTVHSKRVMTLVRINTYTSNILETREELERDKQSFERDEEEMTQPVDPPSNDVTIVVSNQRKNGGRNVALMTNPHLNWKLIRCVGWINNVMYEIDILFNQYTRVGFTDFAILSIN